MTARATLLQRRKMLEVLAGAALLTVGGCDDGAPAVKPPASVTSTPTAVGSQLYPADDIGRSIALLKGMGATFVRVSATLATTFLDTLVGTATRHGMRVLMVTADAAQPVDIAAYAQAAAQLHVRYAAANPIWEIWNEPNLAQYWNGPPDVGAYLAVLAPTAKALRDVGATDVWTGGTSGVDLNWIYNLATRDGFRWANGCAVHSYKPPGFARTEYIQAKSFLPAGVLLHTTETCIASSLGSQSQFFDEMWYLHRELGLPTLIWCEFRDGTAGNSGAFSEPYGLVTADYAIKSVYAAVQLAVRANG